ncbi:solute carrier family 35 member F3-like [Glandiceps talaboti]
MQKFIVGETWGQTAMNITIIVLIGGTLSSSMQLATCMYAPSFDGTMLYIWFSTAWLIAFYPLSKLVQKCCKQENSGERTRSCDYGNSFNGFSLRVFVTKIWPMCLLWLLANYLFLESLTTITATDASAIFSTSSAYICIFAVFLFHESIQTLRAISIFLSLFGFLLILYIDGALPPGLTGVLLCLGATTGGAFYKVLFHNILGDASLSNVSLFMTLLGICDLLCMWLIPYLFHISNQESYMWENVPWSIITVSALSTLVFNCLVIFGSCITSPVNISLGTLMAIPVNAVVDVLAYEVSFSWMKIIAFLSIISGFVTMMAPVSEHHRVSCSSNDNEDYSNSA